MNCRHAYVLVTILLFSATLSFSQMADYQMEVSANTVSYELQGFATVSLNEIPSGNSLIFSRNLTPEHTVELVSVFQQGAELAVSQADGRYSVSLAGLSAPLSLEIEWRIAEMPEHEGIIELNDYSLAGSRFAWYPRALNAEVGSINVDFLVQGEGRIAANAVYSTQENLGGMRQYELQGQNSLMLYLSPIFVETSTFADQTAVSVFMREGSDQWKNRISGYATETLDFYEAAIPGFSFNRLDIVVAGREHALENAVPGLVIIEDVIDHYISDLGAVFTGNYIRWQLSVKLAGAYFSREIETPAGALPWLVSGLSLHFAEEYAQAVLLGGPAFENIKQQYLNTGSTEADVSLNQTTAEAGALAPVLSHSKGFWVVGMLRQEMERRAFEAWIDRMLDHNGPVDNETAEQYASQAAGRDLSGFFQTWVYSGNRLDIAIEEARQTERGVELEIENSAALAVKTPIQLTLETGQDIRRVETIPPGKSTVTLETEAPVRRLRIDPGRTYPDVNRANNVRSFGSTEAIDQLYAIDNYFVIGDLVIVSEPVPAGRQRAADFRMTVTNRRNQDAYLGLHLTTGFPGVRNRGISRILIQLAPEETQTIQDLIFIPTRGFGPMTIKAEYFILSSRDHFEALDRSSDPSLVSWYTYGIKEQ